MTGKGDRVTSMHHGAFLLALPSETWQLETIIALYILGHRRSSRIGLPVPTYLYGCVQRGGLRRPELGKGKNKWEY